MTGFRSRTSVVNWKKKYHALLTIEMRRLKQLEDENVKLKKLVADLSLCRPYPPKAMKPGRKRKLVDEVRSEWQVSIRRTYAALECDRSTYHYKSRRSGQAALEHQIKEICHARVRYGYRRVHVLLRREGRCHGQNKTRRIYRELGLQLRNKTPKRCAASRPSCVMIAGQQRVE